MTTDSDYIVEKGCFYKEEQYLVRDNGAIMRKAREGKRVRKFDNVWTFGNKDDKTGYMLLGQVRVHIVVATAFHGFHDSKHLVVDHIDTNRCNNRPENLRWVTRLENALNNEFTRSKIIYICGSVEAFLKNPTMLTGHEKENPNFGWMHTVTKDEAKNTLENLKTLFSHRGDSSGKGLGDWVFGKNVFSSVHRQTITEEYNSNPLNIFKDSLTKGAMQDVGWNTPNVFPLCPSEDNEFTLENYFKNLKKGHVFSKDIHGTSTVLDAVLKDEEIIVKTKINSDVIRKWSLISIKQEQNKFLHKIINQYQEEIGLDKYYTLYQGLEWTGGECLDDFC